MVQYPFFRLSILLFYAICFTAPLAAQVSVNQDNAAPDPSAMLDVKSSDKGMLVPRMTTAQRNLIASPATGLLVFDTDTETFWFRESAAWVELVKGWSLSGNTGTDTTTNFIGTTDNMPLDFRANNHRSLRLEYNADAPNIIGGYSGNNVSAGVFGATVSGGGAATIISGGGSGVNSVTNNFGTVAGGGQNIAGGELSTVSGGGFNIGSGKYSTVSGGSGNAASGLFSTVGGGRVNTAAGFASTVAGGFDNNANSDWSFAAGSHAKVNHEGTFVWADNSGSNFASTANHQFLIRAIGGVGINKNDPATALDVNGTVTATAFVGNGSGLTGIPDNQTLSLSGTTLSIEDGNSVDLASLPSNDWSLIGNAGTDTTTNFIGTTDNMPLDFRVNNERGLRLIPTAGAPNIVAGYIGNIIAPGIEGATISGGGNSGMINSVEGDHSAIGGGNDNTVLKNNGFIGAGAQNTIDGPFGFIGGGSINQASGTFSAILAGRSNIASGFMATIAGGESNTAAGSSSFAAGYRAKANHDGTFVWADNTVANFASTAEKQFLIRATNGVGINKNNPATALDVNGTVTATAFVGNGSGLTGIPDDQTLSLSGTTLSIEDGNAVDLASIDTDTDDQTLSLSGTTLSIEDGNSVDLASLSGDNLGNHIATQTFDLANNDISNGGTVTATAFVGDGSGLTDIPDDQTLSLSGTTLSIEDGNSVDLFSLPGDNLGNHTATLNVNLNGNYLSGDGDNEGVFVDADGKVGLGTTTPADFLEVAGSATGGITIATPSPVLKLNDTNANYWEMKISGSNLDFSQQTFGTAMRLEQGSGNVGIGVNNPAHKLDVNGTVNATAFVGDGSGLTGIPDDQTLSLSGTTLSIADGNSVDLASLPGDNLGNHTATQNVKLNGNYLSGDGGNEGVFVDGDGNVGIGTSAPIEGVQIHNHDVLLSTTSFGPGPALRLKGRLGNGGALTARINFENNDVNSSNVDYIGASIVSWNDGNTDDGDLRFYTASDLTLTQAMRITSNGNVSIGAGAPANKLSVSGSANFSGNVGIGITTPGEKLQVNGGNVKISQTASGTAALLLEGQTGLGNQRTWSISTQNNSLIPDGSDLTFSREGSESMRILTNGRVGIGTSSPDNNLSVSGNTDFTGNVGIGTSSPDNKLEVQTNVTGANNNANNYAAKIRNTNTNAGTEHGLLALQFTANLNGNPGNGNWIQFFENNTDLAGKIENNNNGNVQYESGGSDYAEMLERLDHNEAIQAGDVVGLFGGKISKRTEGADWVMAISDQAVVLGNAIYDGSKADYEIASFIGQVPVQVRGKVAKGDYIVASGQNDGTAIAVSPEDLQPEQGRIIVGRAWEDKSTDEVTRVNTVVGLPESASTTMALARRVEAQKEVIASLNAQVAALQALNQDFEQRLTQIEAALQAGTVQASDSK